ncbi:MAG: J domain-containing protein [Spirochaetaceae bacterium]|jgi:DnaJ-domain-containing protein 1|nr:J domain-containing protein [Spirochaetaceae bacterium]
MGIFERLGNVLKSYLAEEAPSGHAFSNFDSRDADLAAAFNELNEFLNDKNDTPFSSYTKPGKNEYARRPHFESAAGSASFTAADFTAAMSRPPEKLRADFAELEVPFGATEDECKSAYKRLLKKHHPDRHAGHAGNMKKATEKAAKINTAYERIRAWREKEKK